MEGHVCKKCVLTDQFFSVKLDEEGVCNYCRSYEKKSNREVENENPQTEELESINNKNGSYDILLAYSGGKDSTFTLYLLRKVYNLRVLAVTYDNGFLSEETYQNIRKVTETLDVDSMIIAPSKQKLVKIFQYANKEAKIPPKALERASAICTYCIGLVKSAVYSEAVRRKIPYVTFGWTPGQASTGRKSVKMKASMIKMNFKQMREGVVGKFGKSYESFFMTDEFLDLHDEELPAHFYPFSDRAYNEEELIAVIEQFGWRKPNNTDCNSTNCILNTYAIKEHLKRYHFHPYALELAELVRKGQMFREEALNRIDAPLNKEVCESVDGVMKKYEL